MTGIPYAGDATPAAARGTDARPVPFRGGGFAAERRPWAALVAFVALIALWEGAVRSGAVSAVFLPAPSAVVKALWDLAVRGTLWRHLSDSLYRLSLGWLLGTACGLLAGFSIGVLAVGRAVGLPLVSALFPVPKIALLPLLILWLGIGEAPKVATVALGVFFPTVIATYSGIDGVARSLIRMGQSFDMPPRAILAKIVLPGSLPSILAGFRITVSIGLILLVSAEMIGAQYGIGSFILAAGNLYQTDQLLAGVTLLSILGLVLHGLLARLERRLLAWR
jgi:NitT/TauT family transport system permease protein